MHADNAGIATLARDLGREIDFVMRRPNTRAYLRDEIARWHAESCFKQRDRARDDAEFGAFATGMNEADGAPFAVDEINGGAIGDVNAERQIALVSNQTIAAVETSIGRQRLIDDRDLVAMNLFRGREGKIANFPAQFPMDGIEVGERDVLIVRDIDAGNAPGEAVPHAQGVERDKLLERATSQTRDRLSSAWSSPCREDN